MFSIRSMRLLNSVRSSSFVSLSKPSITSMLLNDRSKMNEHYNIYTCFSSIQRRCCRMLSVPQDHIYADFLPYRLQYGLCLSVTNKNASVPTYIYYAIQNINALFLNWL